MEIKHTIEILTKDIQDIEKLVRNLNNYTTPPQIELDLALSKLRQVYELLSIISNDSKNDKKDRTTEQSLTDSETQTAEEDISIEEEIPSAAIKEEVAEEIEEEPIPKEETTIVGEEVIIPKEPQFPELFDEEELHEQETPAEEAHAEETAVEEAAVEEATVEEAAVDQFIEFKEGSIEKSASEQEKPKEGTILADKFEKDKSLNDKIAPGVQPDLSTKIKGGPIDSIKRNIGINDRFLIIRELMNGDSEAYNIIIQSLDDCTNFNEAFKHIQTRFPDHLEHEGVKILINLSRRKFISSGNV